MKDLTKGPELKLIFLFSVPMILGSIFQQLYSTADAIIVGKFVSKEALASIGTSFPVVFLLTSLAIGITIGTTIVVSQFFGAKQFENVKLAVTTTFIFLFAASVIITFLGIVFSPLILQLMSIPDAVFNNARLYLQIMISGIICIFGYNGVSAILRGLGDSKTPLIILLLTSLLNVILDLIFIIPLKMGVFGAALATVISQGISFVGSIIYLYNTHELLKFRIKEIRFDCEIFLKILKMGIPSGIQQMSVSIGMMVIVSIVNSFGTDAIAAFTAAGRLDTFASMPSMSISLALASFTGQNIGANKTDRVHKGLRSSLIISVIYSLCITAAAFLFRRPLIGLFNSDQNVVAIGSDYLVIVGSSYIIFSTMFMFNGLLRGAGDAVFSMFCTIFATWPIRIIFAVILSKFIGVRGIWYSIPLGWFIGMILLFIRYKTGIWKTKTIVKPVVSEIVVDNEIINS